MNNQSEDRVLGTVGIYLRGEYDSSVKYEYMNQVTYQGSSYTCIKEEGCTEIDPTNEDYWICSAKKGNKGDKGDTGDIGPIGPKPVNGVDYNTNAEREEFKNAVVADSKADLEKYITEKETHLDNYTKDKETKLDDYVTDTVKPAIDTYVTDTTKKSIDAYEKEKEKVLDTYTDTKKTEIDNYITNTSKPALDQYEKDKEAELETAKNTAIVEYDAHAESVLTETEDLFNALNTEKASGTELYIEDAKPCRAINTEIDAMYAQKTTTGAQLLDSADFLFTNNTLKQNGLEVVINEDGSITINGTATNNTYLKKNLKSVLEDGNYYFYNFNNINQSNKTYYMLIQGRKSTGYTPADYYNTRGYQTDNFIKDTETYDASFDCLFVFKEGFVANNLKLYPVISKTAQTGFEPYTGKIASPSLDYPQAIEQIENVKLMHDSSNLFNVTDYTILNLVRNGNAKITKTKDNFSFVTSTENYCGVYIIVDKMKEYIDNSKDDITYNISFDVSATQNTDFRYGTTDFKYTTIKTNKTRISFSGILAKPFTLYSLSQQANTTVIVSNIKVTKNEDTEYTTHQNQTINIDLKGNKLCAISNIIKDKLLIDRSGNVVLQKNVNKYIFTGNENFIINSTTDTYNEFTCVIPNLYPKKYFETKSNKFLYNLDNRISISDTGASYIRTPIKLQIDTIDKFKTNIKDTEVYYVLATPEIIDLGQLSELPKTFNGINNIWAETNLGNTEIEIEYVQDVKKLLEKQAEQQNARLDNIEALLSTTETSALLLDNMQTDLESEVK